MEQVTLITVKVGSDDTPRTFRGRKAWCLDRLLEAGERGITVIEAPAPRVHHYVFALRRDGILIDTKEEKHSGPYGGHHGRYVLRSKVKVVKREVAA